jgi:hypothetical protein
MNIRRPHGQLPEGRFDPHAAAGVARPPDFDAGDARIALEVVPPKVAAKTPTTKRSSSSGGTLDVGRIVVRCDGHGWRRGNSARALRGRRRKPKGFWGQKDCEDACCRRSRSDASPLNDVSY